MIIEFIFPTSTIYVTEEFSDRVYIEDVIVNVSGDGGGGGGVTDHGLLTGLADDDHTQYLTQARGDARYYTETEVDTLLSGKANTSHTHIIGDVTGLQTALDGKASTSHTHIIGDVTGLQTALDGKAATSHSHVIADVTGLQTALDGKQETLVSGTNIKTINSESILGSGNITAGASWGSITGTITSQTDLVNQLDKLEAYRNYIEIETALGGSPLAYGAAGPRMFATATLGLTDARATYLAVLIPEAMTITGVRFFLTQQGNFTADAENAVALYSYSGGTITRVAISANDGNIWKGSSNTLISVPFTGTYAASKGLFYVGYLYNNSAQTTAPAVAVTPSVPNLASYSSGFTNSARIVGVRNTQSALPSSETMPNLTGIVNIPYVELY